MNSQRIVHGDGFAIEITEDGLTARLSVDAGSSPSAGNVFAKLKELKLKGVDDGILIEAIDNAKTGPLSLVIATGQAAVDDRPGRVDFRIPLADSVNGIIAKIDAGQVIATYNSETPGTDGCDVFGQPIAHKQITAPFGMGSNLTCDKGTVVAAKRGNVRIHNGRLSVLPLLEVHGDDDGGSAQLDFDGDVWVKGSFRDGRKLTATGSLVVGGAIEAAQIKINGFVHVKGGIIGKQRGECVVGGELRTRFLSAAHIIASGDIVVQSEVTHSRVACAGRMSVINGPICGGEISANGGITCQVLGNASSTPTLVEAGTDQTLRSLISIAKVEIDGNRKRIQTIREKIAPLMKQMKHLSPQQREKVTELLSDAEELEARTDKMYADIDERARDAAGKSAAEIVVAKTLYPGVTIRFGGVEAVITTEIKGPIKIVPRKSGAATEIAIFEEGNESAFILKSHAIAYPMADDRHTTPLARAG